MGANSYLKNVVHIPQRYFKRYATERFAKPGNYTASITVRPMVLDGFNSKHVKGFTTVRAMRGYSQMI